MHFYASWIDIRVTSQFYTISFVWLEIFKKKHTVFKW